MIDYKLADKIVLVSGANHGIGSAIAQACAEQSSAVFITSYCEPPEWGLEPKGINNILSMIRANGGRVECQEMDLSNTDSISQLFDQVEIAFGSVDILVNNAAAWQADTFIPHTANKKESIWPPQSIFLSAKSYDKNFAINSRATALMMAEFARRHIEYDKQWGRIINISTGGAAGFASEISYGASKHAMESYSRAAAKELGRYGITVNIIAPGPVNTGWVSPELEETLRNQIPLGRVGHANDIADAVLFFASEQARWITGQLLYVDGGDVMPL
ncbi:MAG: hypothetical protein B6242_08340 [Anaerolineaceae bacterium 4572_78]|nr:MAG: hypothetical protein B6242_08340 [Anaerolineaceae bacterium 4572_78]